MITQHTFDPGIIFDITSVGYLLLDADLNVILFNEPADKFVSEELHETLVEGTSLIIYFSKEKQENINKCLQNALTGISGNCELCFTKSVEHDKWYNAVCHPVYSNKEIPGVLVEITDITKWKSAELKEQEIAEDLLQRNKALEQFSYIISHNLRAPLTSIMGISNALMQENVNEHDTKIFMEGINTSVQKLDNVIADLNIILHSKTKINEHRQKVRLSQVVKDIEQGIGNYRVHNEVIITTDFGEVDEVSILKSYICSIFFNLISNSVKYKKPDVISLIEIKSSKTTDKIVITFKDNGMGIDLEKHAKQIFGLYKRFHFHAAEGKGMGLFMVKTQVEALGGKITVKSKINEGTEFKIEFKSALALE